MDGATKKNYFENNEVKRGVSSRAGAKCDSVSVVSGAVRAGPEMTG